MASERIARQRNIGNFPKSVKVDDVWAFSEMPDAEPSRTIARMSQSTTSADSDPASIYRRVLERLDAVGLTAHAAGMLAKKPSAVYNIKRAVERADRQGVSMDTLRALAPILQTTVGYLADGTGDDEDPHSLIEIKGLIGAGGSIDTSTEQTAISDMLRCVRLPVPVPDRALAWEVAGMSMFPRYDPGDIVVTDVFARYSPGIIGSVSVVLTAEGSRLLKRVAAGSRPGLYHLESHNAPLMADVEVVSFARIIAVVPAAAVDIMSRTAESLLAR
jgi:hypothetical protein